MLKVNNLPDFLIVGAMKAGTTTLMRYIQTHPDIGCPFYEVHYFNKNENYNKGIDWYRHKFKKFQDKKILGEKTPAYSYEPAVPKRIYDLNPNMKLIWVFRNPVSRAYSQYWHAIMNGYEYLAFEELIDLDKKILEENIYRDYKRRSIYVEQVNRYLEYFPMENMHFIILEDFKKNKDFELERLSKFLGVENNYKELLEGKRNAGFEPASVKLEYFSKKVFGNSFIWRAIHFVNRKLGRKYPPMKKETEKELEQYFYKYNRKLEEVIQMEIKYW